MKSSEKKLVTMMFILRLFTWNLVIHCSGFITMDTNETTADLGTLMENEGYPKPGDIPVLNRKVFRGQRVTIGEHPYVVSIRRRHAHYLVGTLLTKNVVITVAHPLVNVSPAELGVVVGENYCDRGTFLATVLLLILHPHFDAYTLKADIAMVRFYEDTNFRFAVKAIPLVSSNVQLDGLVAFLTGWGRCDSTGVELCLDRSSIFLPGERIDPMLRSISFTMSTSNLYCEGYRRHEISIPDGTLCMGPSREEDPVCPCLGVPGAPLVAQSRLVGLLSWGFGCGYEHDLPLIYTSIQHQVRWILHNIVVMGKLKQANLTQLFQATKAYLIAEWFIHTRVLPPNIQLRQDESMEPLDIDPILASMQGTVYDVRDFISGGAYHAEKQNLYATFVTADKKKEKLSLLLQESQKSKMELKSFLFNNTDYFDKWFPNTNKFVGKKLK